LEVSKLFQCHQKIKAKMETLHQSGMRMELEWTPGHAEVQGNEIADRLAKEAAKEAQEQDTTVHTMVTKQDIKTASRNSISEKWQHEWENSDRGRSYFKYHPNISETCRRFSLETCICNHHRSQTRFHST
jgi:hypothetical protein